VAKKPADKVAPVSKEKNRKKEMKELRKKYGLSGTGKFACSTIKTTKANSIKRQNLLFQGPLL
jgi:hypothetical protein